MSRPTYAYEVPDGWELVAEVDSDWRILPSDTTKRCRRTSPGFSCPNQPTAELNRARPWSGRSENWWAYCPEHMYGRWVENGLVMEWHSRELVAA